MINFKRNSELFDRYYEKTGLKLTEEVVNPLPEEISDKTQRIYETLAEVPHKHIPELENMIKEYPDIPTLKNHLYNAYQLARKKDKANILLTIMLRDHPDYLFAKCQKILSLNDPDDLKKNAYLLGEPREIRSLMDDEEVHFSAFKTYQFAACHLEALTGDIESAKDRIRTLLDLGCEEEELDVLIKKITMGVFLHMQSRFEDINKGKIEVKTKARFESNHTESPVFQNQLIADLFYNMGVEEISKSEIEKVLLLPKDSLIADLEKVVMDSIYRWDYFGTLDYEYSTHEFLSHALYFLGELKAEKSLDTVLNCLRMGDEFMGYWYDYELSNTVFPAVYFLGQQQLGHLKNFVLEPNLYSFDRIVACEVVAQVALHHPERRTEVVTWFAEVLDHHLDNPNDKGIIDTVFLSFTIARVLDFRGKELLSRIEQINEKGWLQRDVCGDIVEVKNRLLSPPYPRDKKPMPENIFEFYNLEYENRRAPFSQEEKEEIDKLRSKIEDPVEGMVTKKLATIMRGGFREDNDDYDVVENNYGEESVEDYLENLAYRQSFEDPISTVVRDSPKVGRNDPCPCGSGKKYKKCCLN